MQRKQDDDAQKKTSLAVSELNTSIDAANIDTDLKKNLKERLSRIKQPNFKVGETWNSGDKENAIREFNTVNDLLSRAVVSQTNEKRRRLDRINRLKDAVAKYVPTETAIKSFQGGFFAGGGTGIRVDREEAIQMARQQALAPLLAEIKMLEEGIESADDLPTADEEGTQTIGRFKVQES